MNPSKEPKTLPLNVDPTPEYYALMDALDAWIKTAGLTWDNIDRTLAAMVRANHYADAACDCHRVIDHLNWPHRLAPRNGSWRCSYVCRVCGRTYFYNWAPLSVVLACM